MMTLLSAIYLFGVINLVSSQVIQNLTVNVGERAILQCNTTHVNPADWFWRSPGREANQLVSMGREVVGILRGRAVVDFNQGSYCNLLINSTIASDEGVYTCKEDGGVGLQSFAIGLNVVDVEADDAPMGHTSLSGNGINDVTQNSADRPIPTDAPSVIVGVIIATAVGAVVVVVVVVVIIFVMVRRQRIPRSTDESKPLNIAALAGNKAEDKSPAAKTVRITKSLNDANQKIVESKRALESEGSILCSLPDEVLEKILVRAFNKFKADMRTKRVGVSAVKNTKPEADMRTKCTEVSALKTLLDVSRKFCHIIISLENRQRAQIAHTVQLDGEVVGITVLDQLVFLLSKKESEHELLKAEPPKFQFRSLRTGMSTTLCHFVAWQATKSVYVGDTEQACILRVWSGNKAVTESAGDEVTAFWGTGSSSIKLCCLSTYLKIMLVSTSDKKLTLVDTSGKELNSYDLDNNVDPYFVFALPVRGVASYCTAKNISSSFIKSKKSTRFKIGNSKELYPSDKYSFVFESPFQVVFDGKGHGFLLDYSTDCIYMLYEKEMRKRLLIEHAEEMRTYRVLLGSEMKNVGQNERRKLSFMPTRSELIVGYRKCIDIYRVKTMTSLNLSYNLV